MYVMGEIIQRDLRTYDQPLANERPRVSLKEISAIYFSRVKNGKFAFSFFFYLKHTDL